MGARLACIDPDLVEWNHRQSETLMVTQIDQEALTRHRSEWAREWIE